METQSKKSRTFYGMLSGFVAIGCNTLLFGAKLTVGLLFGSMATMADAFNNLSDFGSNVVSMIGFKISSLPADKHHPYGHARAEYIASLIVALVILVLGIELIISGVESIVSKTVAEFSYLTVIVLALSILVKCFMFVFNTKLSKKINSTTLKATAVDSLSDCISTGAVLLSMFVTKWTKVNLDGYMTVAVALFIMYAGFDIIRETFSQLLGEAPKEDLVNSIKQKILSYEGVLGVHDLMCHNYGPSKVIASVHVEVDANVPILESHDLIDNIEMDFLPDVNLVIHLDPIVIHDDRVNQLRKMVEGIVQDIDSTLSVHDVRVVFGITHTNLLFDVAVPFDCKIPLNSVKEQVVAKVKEYDEQYNVVLTLDRV